MDSIAGELFSVPGITQTLVVVVRIVAAGLLGAVILKLADREQIKGLTTAASIWMTAAIGIAAGLGPLWVPVLAAACAWIILYVFARLESGRSPDRG